MVSRSGFGAIPIQRISLDASTRLLRKAFEQGINFFDTAKGYTDSEEKIGYALHDARSQVIIATKSPASDKKGVLADIDNSLRRLQTDYIDILQLHNPLYVPRPGDEHGMYDGLSEAKASGKIRFLGLTNHRLNVAKEAVESDLYDTIQFPFSLLSAAQDLELIQIAKQHDVGAIAMKALSGGLITNAASAFAFLRQYDNVVPIWGIELEAQLDEFLAFEQHPPVLDDAMRQSIERDRKELSGAFCRGCGYCLPCPVEIPIPMAARMALLMGRMPYQQFLSADWKEKMERIPKCIDCRQCALRCPYELDTPALLKREYAAYQEFAKQHAA